MKDSYNSFDAFQNAMKVEHEKLGAKMGKFVLEEMELGQAWERFAISVQNALAGTNPTQIKQRMVQVANNCMYVHEMLERENRKNAVRKIAEARRKETMNFMPRRIAE